MSPDDFWSLVDASRGGDVEEQSERLHELLVALPPEELVSSALHTEAAEEELNTWLVWAAGYLLAGGMSDDSFDYFRTWVVSRGRAVFEAAVQDPDSLASVEPDGDEDGESFGYVVHEVFEELTGDELHDLLPDTEHAPPRGEPFPEDDPAWFRRHLPRLAERHL